MKKTTVIRYIVAFIIAVIAVVIGNFITEYLQYELARQSRYEIEQIQAYIDSLLQM